MSGQFKWVDYSPPAGGASELIASLTGPCVCNLPAVGTEVGQSGVASSIAAGWNSRFGIYFGSVQEGDAVPDYSGYAYTEINHPSKFNALSDPSFSDNFRSKRGGFKEYQGNGNPGLNAKGKIANSAYLTANGADRRMATVAVIDCPAFDSGALAPVTKWACVLMLHPINTSQGGSGTGATRMFLEYLGMSDDPNSPCAAAGTVGGPNSGGPLVPALVQ